MHFVIVLGAGFSHAFGLPTMAGFFNAANDHASLDSKEKAFLSELRQETRDAMGLIPAGPKGEANLEHVLSYALMDFDPEQAKSRTEQLTRILQKVYTPTDPRAVEETAQSKLRSFLFDDKGRLPQGEQISIITLNYDLIAEWSLYCCGIPAMMPGSWQKMHSEKSSPSLYSQRSNVAILKLHGSLNWHIPEDGKTLRIDDGVVGMRTFDGDWNGSQPAACDPTRMESGSHPFLWPPTYFKPQPPSCVLPIWKAAHDALSSANRVLFVGYSFPASDQYMRYFVAKALRPNVNLDSIHMIDPRASSVIKSLRRNDDVQGFGPAILDNMTAVASPWEALPIRLEQFRTRAIP